MKTHTLTVKQFIKGNTTEIHGFKRKKKSLTEKYLPQLPRKLRNFKKAIDGAIGKL